LVKEGVDKFKVDKLISQNSPLANHFGAILIFDFRFSILVEKPVYRKNLYRKTRSPFTEKKPIPQHFSTLRYGQ
jgi:hypothetical protein